MSKRLLVLAASQYQLDTIQTGKRLGYYVITTDNVPANPGHRIADRCYFVDTTDQSGVLQIAHRERIDGIIAPCTDVAVKTAAFVSEQLGLPGPSVSSAEILTVKDRFRAFLTHTKFPCPAAIVVKDNLDPDPVVFIQGTWIIKPARSSGSKGVFIITSEADYWQHKPKSLAFSPDRVCILEQFIEGSQHTCEGVLQEGRIVFHLITDRQTAKPPYVVTTGHCVPTYLPEAFQAKVIETIEHIWELLGIQEGPFDCDFVVQDGDIFILEMTPRLGGNSLSTLVRTATDFDLVEYALRYACRDEPCIIARPEPMPTAILLLGVSSAGCLSLNPLALEQLRTESWVRSLTLDLPLGSPVQPFINGRHRVGEAVVVASNRADLDSKVLELQHRLDLRAV